VSETLFTKVDYDVDTLIKLMRIGTLGLPYIQRRLVWPDIRLHEASERPTRR